MGRGARALRWCAGAGVGTGATALAGYSYWRWQYERTRTPERFVPELVDARGRLLDSNIVISPWRAWLRYLELAWLFIPLILCLPLTRFSDWFNHRWQLWFICTIERSGPAFIKLAQWLATRRDLSSPAFRKVLSRLFNRVSPHTMGHTRTVVETDLGRPLEDIFSEFDEKPVGSGSIAQVHRARLRDDEHLFGDAAGKEVAVKVAHPNIGERIALDFHVLNALARAFDRWFPQYNWLDVPRQVQAWTEHLAQQIDLSNEARNIENFRENFKDAYDDKQCYAEFPTVVHNLVSPRFLVEEFIHGHIADDEYLMSLPQPLRTHIAYLGLETYLKTLLRDNWLHGDLHAGNIIIKDEVEPGRKWPRVYLIDCGLCMKLTPEQGEQSRQMIGGFATWKPQKVAKCFWAWGPGGKQKHAEYDEFLENLSDVMSFYRESCGEDGAIVGRALESCFDVVRDHRIQLESWATNLLFGVLVQEAFIMTLDERFNVIKQCLPWLASEGHFSWGMFRNQFGWVPWFAKAEDKSAEVGQRLKERGQLTVEGEGEHQGWKSEETRKSAEDRFRGGVLSMDARAKSC